MKNTEAINNQNDIKKMDISLLFYCIIFTFSIFDNYFSTLDCENKF